MGKKAVASKKTAKPSPNLRTAEKKANLYLELKDELEIIGGRAGQLSTELKDLLPTVTGEEVEAKDGRLVHLQHKESSTFDWIRAKADASPELLTELAPFVKKEECLDYKAAERLLDMTRPELQAFVVTKASVALCVKPASRS